MASRLMNVAVLALLTLAAGRGAFAAAGDCDRACLRTILDQYLNAVVKHDPAAAPLFAGYREIENAVVVRPGQGVWKTVTALGKVQRRYMDPLNGSVGYFGTFEEAGGTIITTARLKVTGRKISEAEWVITRKDDGGPTPGRGGLMNPEGLAASPPPEGPVAKSARSSREAMIAAANSYFDGLQSHDGSVVLAHPGCVRIENGVTVTGRGGPGGRGAAPPAGVSGVANAGAPVPAPVPVNGDCASGLQSMTMIAVTARRFPIVDEEAGVVLGTVVFLRAPGSPQRRNLLTEWFTIENDKIRGIYAAMYYPDAIIPIPNWPPYDGNWPLAAGGN